MATKESWDQRKWRPYLAWTYIAICLFDFIIAPIINYKFFGMGSTMFQQWKPLTMGDGGMFHIAMGAVLGVSAWKRGDEKMTRYRNGYYDDQSSGTYVPPYRRNVSERMNDEPIDRSEYRDRITRDSVGKD